MLRGLTDNRAVMISEMLVPLEHDKEGAVPRQPFVQFTVALPATMSLAVQPSVEILHSVTAPLENWGSACMVQRRRQQQQQQQQQVLAAVITKEAVL
jgi:hypothetical protein